MTKSRTKARPLSAPATDKSIDLNRLLDVVAAFPRQTICVLGDFVLDEFVSGEISRVSREAPVLILRRRHSEFYPGGAANAVNNLVDLGALVLPVGVTGDDEGGRVLLDYFRRKNVDVTGLSRARGWITPTKTRYLAGWTHTTEQQVLRVDREPNEPLPSSLAKTIAQTAIRTVRRAKAVLISDYGFGAVTPALVSRLKAKSITLDSRHNLLDYRGAGILAATPNEPELEVAYHESVGTDRAKLENLGRRAMGDLTLQALLVTRGKDGMTLFERGDRGTSDTDGKPHYISIYGSNAPVDVTGAGDTVIAVFTLALAAGASYLEAAHLANYAGGIVVMKRRTATVTRAELESVLLQEVSAPQSAR